MYAIFWVGKKSLFGKLISFWKKTNITHMELLFSNGYIGTSDNNKNGIVYEPFKFDVQNWKFIQIPVTKEEEELIKIFFTDEEKGCGYDWKGIILEQVFNLNMESKTNWFCSEACIAALQKIFKDLKKYKPYEVSPEEAYTILKCLGFKEVDPKDIFLR